MKELSILMPAYNEEATVEPAIERVMNAGLDLDFELVLVENGSTDATRDVLGRRDWPPQVRIVHVDANQGKGHGVRTALDEARGTYSAVLDADLEYDPADLARLIAPLQDGIADAVIGTRVFQAHSAYGFWYVMGNRVINTAANVLYNTWLSDVLNCYKLAPTDLLRSLGLREPGFGIDAEIPARLLRSGARIYEVPVTYTARRHEEGKKLRARDGVTILWTLLRCRFD